MEHERPERENGIHIVDEELSSETLGAMQRCNFDLLEKVYCSFVIKITILF